MFHIDRSSNLRSPCEFPFRGRVIGDLHVREAEKKTEEVV